MTRDGNTSELVKIYKSRAVITHSRHPSNTINTQEKSKKNETEEGHFKRKISIVTRRIMRQS